MNHTPALSDLRARYAVADRLSRAAEPHLPSRTRRRVARRLRNAADRLDG